jgi:hypothetical protein
VQRLLRLIARRMKARTHLSRDSFLTREQLDENYNESNEGRVRAATVAWTHYCRFQLSRSYLCDATVATRTPNPHHSKVNSTAITKIVDQDDFELDDVGMGMKQLHAPSANPRRGSIGSAGSRRNEVSVPTPLQHLTTSNSHNAAAHNAAAPTQAHHGHRHQAHRFSYSHQATTQNQASQLPKLERKRAFLKPPSLLPEPQFAEEATLLPVRSCFGQSDFVRSWFLIVFYFCSRLVLGMPWFLLFCSGKIPSSTQIQASRIIGACFLHYPRLATAISESTLFAGS